jgi:hypothetical protein
MVMFDAVWKDGNGRIRSTRVFGELIVPGLVVAPCVDGDRYHGSWSVVHVETGHRVSGPPMCLRHARRAAQQIVALGCDWTQGMDGVKDDPKAKDAGSIHSAEGMDCAGGYCCDDWEMLTPAERAQENADAT